MFRILLSFLLFLSSIRISVADELVISSTEAKLFLSGAQITRSASATAPGGTRTLVFTGLAEGPVRVQLGARATNPTRGDQGTIGLEQVSLDVPAIQVDIVDFSSKRVGTYTIPIQGGRVYTILGLIGSLSVGMYTVNADAGEETYSRKLVIQP